MKGHRKLKPGEVIREGDLWFDGKEVPRECGFVGHAYSVGEIPCYRKARTDGCPPGWRWADEEERFLNEAWWELDSRDESNGVMPYPEDERLKQ